MLVGDYKPKYNTVSIITIDKKCTKVVNKEEKIIYTRIPNEIKRKELLGYLEKEQERQCLIFITEEVVNNG